MVDWLVVEAVWSEPVSEAKFPASRELTGNLVDLSPSAANPRQNYGGEQRVTSKFPTRGKREFLSVEQGIFLVIRDPGVSR